MKKDIISFIIREAKLLFAITVASNDLRGEDLAKAMFAFKAVELQEKALQVTVKDLTRLVGGIQPGQQ